MTPKEKLSFLRRKAGFSTEIPATDGARVRVKTVFRGRYLQTLCGQTAIIFILPGAQAGFVFRINDATSMYFVGEFCIPDDAMLLSPPHLTVFTNVSDPFLRSFETPRKGERGQMAKSVLDPQHGQGELVELISQTHTQLATHFFDSWLTPEQKKAITREIEGNHFPNKPDLLSPFAGMTVQTQGGSINPR